MTPLRDSGGMEPRPSSLDPLPPRQSSIPGRPKGGNADVVLRMEVNRADLERNGIAPPESWGPETVVAADALGLIYSFNVEVEDL